MINREEYDDHFYKDNAFGEIYLCVVAYLFLLFLVVDVNPFPEQYVGDLNIDFDGEGDPIRRGIFSTLFLMVLPLIPARFSQIMMIFKSNKLLLGIIFWCAISPSWALAPEICLRRVTGMLVSFVITLVIATLKPTRIINVLLCVTGTYMIVNCIGMALLPPVRTMHSDGSWRGLHNQKNPAGAAAAVASFLWLQMGLARSSLVLLGGAALWALFMIMTLSKTSIAIFFLLLPYQFLMNNIINTGYGKGRAAILFAFILIIVPAGLIIGYWALPDIFDNITFTGRTYIWSFVWEKVKQSPLLGYGYNSFWAVGPVTPALNEADPIRVGIYAESHNGYLETLVLTGVIGFIPTLIYTMKPFYTFFKNHYSFFSKEERMVIGSFYSLCLFIVFHDSMESDFLQALSFLWVAALIGFIVISIYDVRAKYRIALLAEQWRRQ